jgi:predicted transcriptional regulator
MADQITALREKDMSLVQGLGKRSAESAIKILTRLYAQPIVNVHTIQDWTNFTRDGAYKTIARLVDLGILVPKDIDIKYGQSYIYKDYIKIFVD